MQQNSFNGIQAQVETCKICNLVFKSGDKTIVNIFNSTGEERFKFHLVDLLLKGRPVLPQMSSEEQSAIKNANSDLSQKMQKVRSNTDCIILDAVRFKRAKKLFNILCSSNQQQKLQEASEEILCLMYKALYPKQKKAKQKKGEVSIFSVAVNY